MNNPSHLEVLGLKPTDVWETKVLGSFGEPMRCYTYMPHENRKPGFGDAVNLRCQHYENYFDNSFKWSCNKFVLYHLTVKLNKKSYLGLENNQCLVNKL